MKRKISMGTSLVVAAVVIAGTSGMALANASSMILADNGPLAWRQSHPDGLSVREMQSLWGSWAGQYHRKQPVLSTASAEPSFRASHPDGLSVREMQSLWGSWAGQYHRKQPVLSTASAEPSFRASHPDGLSVREMQSLWGSWAGQYHLKQPSIG